MDIQLLLKELDDNRLGEFFSSGALQRARAYAPRVQDLQVNGQLLQAAVQGSEFAPYLVKVRLETREFFGQRSLEIATRCTCPVVNRCKHAAAVIMAARRPGALVDTPRIEVLQ